MIFVDTWFMSLFICFVALMLPYAAMVLAFTPPRKPKPKKDPE